MTSEESLIEIHAVLHYGFKGLGFVCGVLLFQIAMAAKNHKHLMAFVFALSLSSSVHAAEMIELVTGNTLAFTYNPPASGYTVSIRVQSDVTTGDIPLVLMRDGYIQVVWDPVTTKIGVGGFDAGWLPPVYVGSGVNLSTAKEITISVNDQGTEDEVDVSVNGVRLARWRTGDEVVHELRGGNQYFDFLNGYPHYAGGSVRSMPVKVSQIVVKDFYLASSTSVAGWYADGEVNTSNMVGLFVFDDQDSDTMLPSVTNHAPGQGGAVTNLITGPAVTMYSGVDSAPVHSYVATSRAAGFGGGPPGGGGGGGGGGGEDPCGAGFNPDPGGDDDGDGVSNGCDVQWAVCIGVFDACNQGGDYDGDGIRNNCDTDANGDGTVDGSGCDDGINLVCGVVAGCTARSLDTDGDGLCNGIDPTEDFDGDGCASHNDLNEGYWDWYVGTSVYKKRYGEQSVEYGSCNGAEYYAYSWCERAEYRDYDGDGIVNDADGYPCGDSGPSSPWHNSENCVVAGWNECANAIHQASNCLGCPEQIDIAELGLCAPGATVHPSDADCDYDGDGCKNVHDVHPCDATKGCKCEMRIAERFTVLQSALLSYATGSTLDEIENYVWPELVTAPDCVRCETPPVVDAPFWTWTFTDTSLVPYGGDEIAWGIGVRLALDENGPEWAGEAWPALKKVVDQGVWLFNWLVVILASWTAGLSMIRSIGGL